MDDNPLLTLPHIDTSAVSSLEGLGLGALPLLVHTLAGPHTGGAAHARGPQPNGALSGSSSATGSTSGAHGSDGSSRGGAAGRGGRGGSGGRGGGGHGSNGDGDSNGVVMGRRAALDALGQLLGEGAAKDISQVCERLPVVDMSVSRVTPPRESHTKPRKEGYEPHTPDHHGQQFKPANGSGDDDQDKAQWRVDVQLTRLRGSRGGGGGGAAGGGGGGGPMTAQGRPRVYAPRFPKVRQHTSKTADKLLWMHHTLLHELLSVTWAVLRIIPQVT